MDSFFDPQLQAALRVTLPIIMDLAITISRIWFLPHHHEEGDVIQPTHFDSGEMIVH